MSRSLAVTTTFLALSSVPGAAQALTPTRTNAEVADLGAEFTIRNVSALGGERVFVRTSLGCLVVDADLTTDGLFDCSATASDPGAPVVVLLPHDDGTFETRDASGRVLTAGTGAVDTSMFAAGTDGTTVVVLSHGPSSDLPIQAQLFMLDGTPLGGPQDLGVNNWLSGPGLAVAHDGTGYVIAWTSDSLVEDYPEGERAFVASLDFTVSGTATLGPVSVLSDTDSVPMSAARAFLDLECGTGLCFVSYGVYPSLAESFAWASWSRTATPQLVTGEQRVDQQGAAFEVGGWRPVRHVLATAQGEASFTQHVTRIDAASGTVIDLSDDIRPVHAHSLTRVGARSLVGLARSGGTHQHLLATRLDYPIGAIGDSCSLDADCESGLCGDDDLCASIVLESDAGPTDPDAGTPDAGAPDAGGADAGPLAPDAGTVADASPAIDASPAGGDGDSGGCGCAVGGRRTPPVAPAVLLGGAVLGLVIGARRRSSSSGSR